METGKEITPKFGIYQRINIYPKFRVLHVRNHPIYNWIWKSKCQPKQKIFFQLLLKDRFSTRLLLRWRGMELDTYTCENKLHSAKIRNSSTSISEMQLCLKMLTTDRCHASAYLQPTLGISNDQNAHAPPWKMEAITTMLWCIWKCRIFENTSPRWKPANICT